MFVARSNPCTPESVAAGKFHFLHEDPTKFVQCSQWGQCFVMPCPVGLGWNRVVNTCM